MTADGAGTQSDLQPSAICQPRTLHTIVGQPLGHNQSSESSESSTIDKIRAPDFRLEGGGWRVTLPHFS